MKTKHPLLLDWLKSASDLEIQETGTTRGYLRLIGYGQKNPSPSMSVGIELATKGLVGRQHLRPSDWQRLWPELAKALATLSANLRPNPTIHQSTDNAGILSSASPSSA